MSKHEDFKTAAVLPALMRVSEAQTHFNVSRSTIYRAAKAGEIKLYKRCGTRVDTEELRAWLSPDDEDSERPQ